MIFTTEEFLEVAIENSPEWDLNSRPYIYRCWNQVYTIHENLFSISLELEQKQGRKEMQFITVEVFIYISVYLTIKLCLFL